MTTNKPEVMGYAVKRDLYPHERQDLHYIMQPTPDENFTVPLIRQYEYEALQTECEELRKDAERYRYIKKGNQWIVATTQTGAQLDGEVLDDLIDSEMEQ